jgi:hypothetical protein
MSWAASCLGYLCTTRWHPWSGRLFSRGMWFLGSQGTGACSFSVCLALRSPTDNASSSASHDTGANRLFGQWMEDLQLVEKVVSEGTKCRTRMRRTISSGDYFHRVQQARKHGMCSSVTQVRQVICDALELVQACCAGCPLVFLGCVVRLFFAGSSQQARTGT